MTLKTMYPVIKGNAVSRIELFSKIILRTCLLSESSESSSMDRYFKRAPQKTVHEFTRLGHVVCVFGRSGIGKTWAVHDALSPCIELTSEILRSKQDTLNFLEKIKGTSTPVILDEYESVHDLIGLREISGPPTKGLFVITSQIPVKFDFEIIMYEFPIPDAETIRRIAPGVSDEIIEQAQGDLRFALQSLTFKSDMKDCFQGAKDFVHSLVDDRSNINPADFIGHPIHEPGNVTAILHENYVDSKTCDYAQVIDYMSQAMIFETQVYSGNWELYPYYNLMGCIYPAVGIGHSIHAPLRPGSVWTKHQSGCARAKRITAMSQRVPGKRLTFDELLGLRDHAEHGNSEILKEYKIQPQDLDVMNHLSPLRKIKAKNLAVLKKSLHA